MTTSITATEIWQNLVEVRTSACTYRVSFERDEARVIAPGLDVSVELDAEVHPEEDLEAAAIVIVAQLEGGVEL